MTPFGGISLIVHIMINTYCKLAKKKFLEVMPFVIIIGLTLLFFRSVKSSISRSIEADNNLAYVKEIVYPCKSIIQDNSEKKIILRVDDIQAYSFRESSISIIRDAQKYNMKLVLGIIPVNILEDGEVVKKIKQNKCNLELALHGWDHMAPQADGSFEFESIGKNEALVKIREGKKTLEKISDKQVLTFIPPGNRISLDAKKALNEEGIKYLSGDDDTNSDYGMSVATFDFLANKLIENEEVLKKCDSRFDQKKICVIVVHPQDYMTDDKIDPEKYRKFTDLLTELRNRNVYSTTFSEL
jgi:hypothetical protein